MDSGRINGYYGRLYEIKSAKPGFTLQNVNHAWDAGGNLANRSNVLNSDNETFGYDFLDRLTSVSGNYTDSWTYSAIGNILSHNGTSYSYNGIWPHAVTSVGGNSYDYDSNGNMKTRPNGSITWDAENRPVSMIINGVTTNFTYDGDGNRVKQVVVGGNTTLYVNKYFEKNLTANVTTTSYYLGGRLVAQREGTTLRYVHQDHLTGTAVMSNSAGALVSSISYLPYGERRNSQGTMPTDILFTGQRLDSTGLYYYGARYYDPEIGRFISADSIVQSYANPQSLNRYSYVFNNPLKYVDPTGMIVDFGYTYEDLYATEEAGMPVSYEAYALLLAWDELKEAVPELVERLENDEETISIGWGFLEKLNESGEGKLGKNKAEGRIIELNLAMADADLGKIAVALAHEAFHSVVKFDNPGLSRTQDEEIVAFSFGFWTGYNRGYEHGISALFKAIDLASTSGQFERSVDSLKNTLEVLNPNYSSLPDARSRESSWAFWQRNEVGALQVTAQKYWPELAR